MKAISVSLMLLAGTSQAGQKPQYPPVVTAKTLYAKVDLRGKPAPTLEAEQWLTGKAPVTKGKVLVVDFWATWCGPCRDLIPEMNDWSKKYAKDVVFVGISAEKPDVVQKFMKETKMNYHIGIDTKSKMNKALGVAGIPHVMIVSPDGIVRWQGFPGSSEDPLTEKVLEQIIAASKK